MPGIVGVVRSDGVDPGPATAAAARKLQHLDTLTMRAGTFDKVALAQVWRDEAHTERDWHNESNLAVRVAGHVLEDGPAARRLFARDIAATYRSTGTIPAADYDGAFTIVVVDAARKRLLIVSDRVGALPVFYARHQNRFAFGPEIKSVLAAAEMTPRLEPDSVASFLIFGYCLGTRTMFEGVTHLGQASTLTVDMESLAHHEKRYWNLRFRPSRALRSRARAERAIYDTLLASQKLILCDNPASYEVFLSGGLDSRGVVAFADVLGRPPARTFTWGASDTVTQSDAFIARRVAEHFHVPHHFVSYETKEFVTNALDWVYVSELANDNIGWFAEGQPTLANVYRSNSTFSIAGDVAWDSGGFAFSPMEMRRAVLPPDVPIPLAAALTPAALTKFQHVYHGEIDRVLASCENDDLTDRKEYLYLNARVARYILSLGYYREHAVEVRRPFLSKAALDLHAELPQSHRAEKNAYLAMLRHRFPSLMTIPEQSMWSLPDWERELRAPGPLQDMWKHYLQRDRVEAGPMGKSLDMDAFVARRDAYFTSPPPAVFPKPFKARFPLRDRVLPIVQRNKAIDRVSRLVRVGPGFLPRKDFDLMRCVALLNMLDESIDRFAATPAR